MVHIIIDEMSKGNFFICYSDCGNSTVDNND